MRQFLGAKYGAMALGIEVATLRASSGRFRHPKSKEWALKGATNVSHRRL
jgi:hypothetical protein